MSPRPAQTKEPQLNPLTAPAVDGLDAGRESARRSQRRRQRANSIKSFLLGMVACAVVAVAAWVGYTIYDEQQATDRLESEQRRAELQQQGSGNDLRDAITELEEAPKWNGPGNPNFGVGEEP